MSEEAMDTSKDYRLLLVRDAVSRLERIVRVWNLNYPIHKNVVLQKLREARRFSEEILHSYLPLSYLITYEPVTKLQDLGKELAKLLLPPKGVSVSGKSKLHVAEIKYCLLQLINLKPKLALGEENKPEYAVDIVGVEIASVTKHPNASKLYVTKAGTAAFGLTIVTNIESVRKGEIRAAAILPPREFFGVISEAMFCSDPLPKEFLGKRPPQNLISSKEVASAVEGIIRER
ncbi:MAG: tRNA-binding protein [Desulfurococcales archaeon]|nr:tRNA-binding protein [Desulfurococcales archaeon]